MSASNSSTQPERASILLRNIILGLALGIFQTIIWLISEPLTPGITSSPSLLAFLYLVSPLIWVIALLFQGIWIGRRTGLVSQGALTGLFSGLFGGIVAAVGHVLIITLHLSSSDQSQPLLVGYLALGLALEVIVLAISAGAGLGALGGLVGQYLSPARSQAPQPPVSPTYPAPPPASDAPAGPGNID